MTLKEGDMVRIKPEHIEEEDVLEFGIVPKYYYPVVSADEDTVDILTDYGEGVLQKKRYQVVKEQL